MWAVVYTLEGTQSLGAGQDPRAGRVCVRRDAGICPARHRVDSQGIFLIACQDPKPTAHWGQLACWLPATMSPLEMTGRTRGDIAGLKILDSKDVYPE